MSDMRVDSTTAGVMRLLQQSSDDKTDKSVYILKKALDQDKENVVKLLESIPSSSLDIKA